uniref:ATP synthase subunit a n=1 Tax=Colochirus quadrangularis TaxID=1980634 RepID=A0A7G7MWM0_9ECHN|nr:ATP synthase F0 subunit 6 [Colochirus quadrangularis]QNG57229.1 ATP synthase F0 subunit 6 [Colochirus quadrangularis]
MINSLFGQFSPENIIFIPINLTSTIIAISWLFFNFQSNFFSGNSTHIINNTINYINKIIFENSKSNTAPWISTLITIFFLIITINIMGLLPYAFTTTSHISFTYSIAVPLWLSVNILGFYLSFNHRLSHLVPQGTPWYLIPLMISIETISLIAQPIALGLRLAANLTAGHLLIYLLSIASWTLSNNIILSSLTIIILTLLFILEIAVACIQAYVFTSLINFYLDQNI